MAGRKRRRRFIVKLVKCIFGLILAIGGLMAIINLMSNIDFNLPEENTLNVDTSSQRSSNIITKETNIKDNLLKNYPTLDEFIGVENKELKDVLYSPSDDKFVDYGYVNSVSVSADDNTKVSINFRKAFSIEDNTIFADPGIYYISNNGVTSKYTVPPVKEIIEEINVGDDVKTLKDLKDVINKNLDIYNTEIKFVVSKELKEDLKEDTQSIHKIADEIIKERPELSCRNYVLQVTRDKQGKILEDGIATISFKLDEVVNDSDYEGQCLYLVKSVDAWLSKYSNHNISDEDYIASCLDYVFKNFQYKDTTNGSTSSSHPVVNLISTKKGVCDSFSNFLNVVLNTRGIPSEMITGTFGGTGENHGWNSINLKGKDYMIDVTACLTCNETPTMSRAGITAEDFRYLKYGIETQLAGKNYADRYLVKYLCRINNEDPQLEPYTNSVYVEIINGKEPDVEKLKRIEKLLKVNNPAYYDILLTDGTVLRRYTK